ncbi:MAG: hypothetical protein RSA12_07950 [Clostridia bacterium]
MKVNTTQQSANDAIRAAQIEKAYRQTAGDDRAERRVRVRIPLAKTGDEVVEVGYNGRMFLIKRGETVELPAELVEILEHAQLI